MRYALLAKLFQPRSVSALLLLSCVTLAPVVAANSVYTTEVLVEGLEHPWGMDMLPDGRMLVTERVGRMRVVERDGTLNDTPVTGLPEVWVQAQAGLFAVKVAPDYAQTSHIYWTYACGSAHDSSTCMARGVLNEAPSGSLSLTKVTELFRSSPGRKGSAHYGGRFIFLPDDTI